MTAWKMRVEDAQGPLKQLAGLGRLPHLGPRDPQIAEGGCDLGVVGAELPLLDAQRPLKQVAGLGRLPQLVPRDPQIGEGGCDLGVSGPNSRSWMRSARSNRSRALAGCPREPRDPQIGEGGCDLGVVGAELPLLDAQRPLMQLAGLGRLPQLLPRDPRLVRMGATSGWSGPNSRSSSRSARSCSSRALAGCPELLPRDPQNGEDGWRPGGGRGRTPARSVAAPARRARGPWPAAPVERRGSPEW